MIGELCSQVNYATYIQEELANGKERGAVETMMAQLQSVNIEDKVCGCHALTRH